MTKWAFAAACMLTSATVCAGIAPTWRVNPISTPPPGGNPQLIGAISISLMVELNGESLFSDAGLDLSTSLPRAFYFNQTPFGWDFRPNPALLSVFPDLYFDTYVANTNDVNNPALQGRLNGAGAAQVGVNGADGGEFNVVWDAVPDTGGVGRLEIARITFLASSNLAIDPIGTAIAPSDGFVRDNLNPTVSIALPPIPLVVIPEPAALAPLTAIMVGLAALRRQRN